MWDVNISCDIQANSMIMAGEQRRLADRTAPVQQDKLAMHSPARFSINIAQHTNHCVSPLHALRPNDSALYSYNLPLFLTFAPMSIPQLMWLTVTQISILPSSLLISRQPSKFLNKNRPLFPELPVDFS